MPVPQRVDFLVGWASCPEKIIENGAISQLQGTTKKEEGRIIDYRFPIRNAQCPMPNAQFAIPNSY
ncbi:hypothetical protein QUA56_23580 [Microcoleus sp. N3A4]|uniref:hypothetical protein n=1 Tax=Microcoleus sp. N3A4 TaxID=3055379 RepID=UPI002FD1C435